MKIEDTAIAAAAKNLTISDVALLLNTLTAERAERLSFLLPSDVLKEALQKLEEPEFDQDAVLIGLLEKLEQFANEKQQSNTGIATRFILRLVYNGTIDDEEKIAELIPSNDWDLKIKIMRTKFFYKDLKYVDMKYIKLILDVLAPRHRANLLLLFPKNIKENYLQTLTDGSKLKDMLLTEIEQISRNDVEMTDILKKRHKIIQGFLDNLRPMIARNDAIIKEIILKQCEEQNLDLPDFVKVVTPDSEKIDESSETAA